MEIYDWRMHHYEKVESLKKEIYGKVPELDEKTDALNCMQGITAVDGIEGISFNVDLIYGFRVPPESPPQDPFPRRKLLHAPAAKQAAITTIRVR